MSIGNCLAFLKVLFPTWKFFDHFEDCPLLLFRICHVRGDWGSWERVLDCRQFQRGVGEVLLNPRGNLWLAQQALVDALATNPEDEVGCRLVERLVRERVSRDSTQFQFKIVLGHEDLLISKETWVHESLS